MGGLKADPERYKYRIIPSGFLCFSPTIFYCDSGPIALVDMAETRFKLNTGAEIPALGFGTWQSPAGEVQKAVKYALSVGYKHVDGGTTPTTPSL